MRSTIFNAALGAVLAASISQATVVQPAKRDLPSEHGCAPCPGGDAPFYQAAVDAFARVDPALLAEGTASFGQTFEAGYWPPLCDADSINCVTAGEGVTWTGDSHPQGLTGPVGRWKRRDKTETIAWSYWQSTLQWVCDGGSGTTYNAHCVMYTCAKGAMRADLTTGENVQGDGETDNNAADYCKCFVSDLNADITFSKM